MKKEEIKITLDDAPASEDIKQSLQARPSFEDAVRRTLGSTVNVSLGTISEQLLDTYDKVTSLIASLPQDSHGCKLQTISFTLMYTSSGEVSLLSAVKGQISGQTGITFTISK